MGGPGSLAAPSPLCVVCVRALRSQEAPTHGPGLGALARIWTCCWCHPACGSEPAGVMARGTPPPESLLLEATVLGCHSGRCAKDMSCHFI